MTADSFFALWMAEGFLRSLSFSWREAMVADFFFFMAEIPALFLLSFCYKGRIFGRLGTALFLPMLYWALKWTVLAVFFRGREVSGPLYFLATAAGVLFLFLIIVCLEMVRKSRRERERECLEAEIRMYERQFDLIRLTYDRKVLCIRIRNSCPCRAGSPGQRKGRGLGLANVRRITERYHGSLTVLKEDGWFQSDVLLFLP